MYNAVHSQLRTVRMTHSTPQIDTDGKDFAKSLRMLTVALIIVFASAEIFTLVTAIIQDSRGIESGSASLAESKANLAKEPKTPDPPAEIPIFKGGSLSSAGGSSGALAYDVVFPLGSISEIQTFYRREMTGLGWREYAGSAEDNVFISADGSRRVSLNFKYYGGNVRLRILTSQ